jgi:hypothetical protein
MLELYILYKNGKLYKVYDKLGALKNAIRQHSRGNDLTYQKIEVAPEPPLAAQTVEQLMGQKCPHCGAYRYSDKSREGRYGNQMGFYHAWECPLRRRLNP